MRVSHLEISRNFLSDIGALNEELTKLSRQISSGKALTSLKDSPSGSAELVAIAKLESDIDQFRFNTDAGSLYMKVADSALNEVNNLLTSIYTKGSQSASELMNSNTRSALAYEIRSLRNQIVELANSAVRGRHIFAGSVTDRAPFTVEGDSISYQGDETINKISIDSGTAVQMNFSGSAVFGPIFAAVNSLLTAIDADDIEGIKTALDQFSSVISDLGKVRGQVGTNMSVLQDIQTRLESREVNLKEQRSRIEDTDLAQAVVQLRQAQTALDAAMSAGGAVLTQRNLFDILG